MIISDNNFKFEIDSFNIFLSSNNEKMRLTLLLVNYVRKKLNSSDRKVKFFFDLYLLILISIYFLIYLTFKHPITTGVTKLNSTKSSNAGIAN